MHDPERMPNGTPSVSLVSVSACGSLPVSVSLSVCVSVCVGVGVKA
jgi:hypothetical protein